MSCKHLLPSRRRRRQRCALEGLFIGPPTAACQLPPWEEGYCPEPECPWRNRGFKPLPVDYAGIRGQLPEGRLTDAGGLGAGAGAAGGRKKRKEGNDG